MTEFRTSSFSSGGNCVEVAFRPASQCSGSHCVEVGFTCAGGECVEVDLETARPNVLVRDSKDLTIPPLRFTAGEWSAFLRGAKAGEFDLPA